MPGTTTTSTNIAILNSQIFANLCDGKFYIDLSVSSYIGGGASNVLGANVQITNPYGVIVKPYGTNYEIAPDLSGGMDAVISFNIPTQAGNFQYGKYKVDVQLFDGSNSWTVTKYISVCEPDKNNKARNYGSLSAELKASCKNGKLSVIVDGVPNYNGTIVESQTNSFTLEYPTSSGLPVLTTSIGSFNVKLYEGVYKITGEICATYNFGDNVYVRVKYKIKKEKNVRCLIDECCVFSALAEINLKLDQSCTIAEKENFSSITLDALRLTKMIQLAADCGEDASDYIDELEKLLGCKCTCNCAEGTPIINTDPAKDFSITGCNVTKETIGLTDFYTIENYDYEVTVEPNGGVLTVSSPTLDDCKITYNLTFNVATLYAQIKGLATPDGDFWASVVNGSLLGIDPSCLGVSQTVWNNWTFKEKIAAVVAKLCSETGCDAAVTDLTATQVGNDVLVSWTNGGSVFCIDIFLDGVFQATVCPGLIKPEIHEYTFENVGDFIEHTYTLIPKCSNGQAGTPSTDTFQIGACPDIAPPDVSSNNVNGVECPYDLTSLLSELPAGITVDWHTANNTNASSLVPDETAVSSGIYYAFAKDADGCYSLATQVKVVCDTSASCTAPQNLSVINWGGGHIPGPHFGRNVLVLFASAAYPPPANSYTVKRRLASDPDVDGSYTTLDTPVWSTFFNKWIVYDTAVVNTLYVYKAFSNCGDSPATTPYSQFTWAVMTCNAVSVTPGDTYIDYSFNVTNANEIDKFEISIYDETGTILIHTDTYTPAYSSPLEGTFEYLEPLTNYKIIVVAFIGSFKKTSCDVVNTATIAF